MNMITWFAVAIATLACVALGITLALYADLSERSKWTEAECDNLKRVCQDRMVMILALREEIDRLSSPTCWHCGAMLNPGEQRKCEFCPSEAEGCNVEGCANCQLRKAIHAPGCNQDLCAARYHVGVRHTAFECAGCHRLVGLCMGAADDYADLCDDCAAQEVTVS